MVEKDAKLLADKYRKGKCNPEELALIEGWYLQLKAEGEAPGHDRIESSMAEVWAALNVEAKPTLKLWPRIRVAVGIAAAVTAIALCIYFFNVSRHLVDPSSQTAGRALLNDVAPGRNGATITLGNGKVIQLSGEKKGVVIGNDLKYADNTPVINDKPSSRGDEGSPGHANSRDLSYRRDYGKGRDDGKVAEMTASTAKGQTYEFTLPDGTHVWLNADSKISFPSQFTGKERKILLSGEAYFAVVHNAKQPFRVESRGQVVEDIGTAFNISAYPDDASTKTTLTEGSALVRHLDDRRDLLTKTNKGVILNPNQQAINDGTIKVTTINPEEAIAWKQGYFKFNEEPLEDILKKVARWYNVEIVYTAAELKNIPFSGTITRYGNVSKLLKNLERTELVHFKIEERRIVVVK